MAIGFTLMPSGDRLKALLSKGYFPKELPAAFTTQDFGDNINAIISEWENGKVFKTKNSPKIKKRNKRGCYNYDLENAEIENISTPKKGYERRNIHITHPVPQALLCKEIATNWNHVQKWLARQKFSLDEIRISSSYGRSIKGINFNLHRVKKSYIEATADWLVRTDITRFYPSIYTHSIAWAAYGKENVKRDVNLYKGSLADRLDTLVRHCNKNQTVGIPIGPETSRIIAEVVSARIDEDFSSRQSDIPKESIDRLQDDWFLGLKTLEKAEQALSTIVAIYRSYGLDINGSKTSVARVIGHSEEAWISEIGAFLSHRSGPLKGSRLREFLNLAIRLQSQYQKDAVTNYALSVLENQKNVYGDVEVLESFLLKAAIISPGSMSRICELLINLDFKTQSVSKGRIGSRFTELAERNLTNGNLYECIWQLYTIRGLNIHLKSKPITELSEVTPSSALALVLLDISHRDRCVHKLPKATWEGMIDKDRVRCDWIWLLAYEGFRHGWLIDKKAVMSDAFFHPMASRNVAFYDPKRNVPQTARVVKMRNRLRQRQLHAIAEFLLRSRGIVADDY